MIKDEMSVLSVEDRRLFIQQLADRGWQVEAWDALFETGANVEPEAEAQYAGPSFDLRLEYHAQDRSLLLEIVERDGDVVLPLILHPKDLGTLLDQITAVQDELNKENYTDLVKSLMPLCSLVLTETDEGPFRLS